MKAEDMRGIEETGEILERRKKREKHMWEKDVRGIWERYYRGERNMEIYEEERCERGIWGRNIWKEREEKIIREVKDIKEEKEMSYI